ncbi:DUF4340 domain-containing protein [Yunchengibacter salinarum]|uniref:DUF4340 domain-containing protein n=1 Tax=Yunchengibacter salinarum TaxID=3133399 RepID=UPI0035B5BEFA
MSTRLTTLLGWLTLLAVLGAIWVLFGEPPGATKGGRGEPLFPELANRINSADRLELTGQDRQVTLARADGAWRVTDRAGYPADQARVRDVLRGLVLSRRREPKTANADWFARIGLGEKAVTLTVLRGTGTRLAQLDLGERSANRAGDSLTYVKRTDEPRSWLVTGLPRVSANPGFWIDKTLLGVDQVAIRSVALGGPDRTSATLARQAPDEAFVLADMAEDETPVSRWSRREPARVLSGLSPEDVRSGNNPIDAPVGHVTLTGFDGLVVRLALFDGAALGAEEGLWARISADVAETLPADGDDQAGEETPAADAPAEAPLAEDGAAEEPSDASEGPQARAAALMVRTRGWLYRLPADAADVLTRDRSAFLADSPDSASGAVDRALEAPASDAAGDDGGDDGGTAMDDNRENDAENDDGGGPAS